MSEGGHPRFEDELRKALAGLDFARRRVSFLLGTDEYIRHERRVAFIPRQMASLKRVLRSAGLELDLMAMAGAGARTGYGDDQYVAAGARIVEHDEIASLRELDVLHALKEPTDYESEIPGHFLRLGAVHLASYPPGLCRLLARRSFTAVFDGGTVGNCSYLLDGGDRTPIVASMSRFAGAVAGRKLVEGLRTNSIDAGKIVIVGGGVAGLAALHEVRRRLEELVVIEPHPPTQKRLPGVLAEMGIDDFEIRPELDDTSLDDAVGIVFAHRSGAKAAEKVCTYDQIRRMRKGAAVVDIAIDQGGSIYHDDYSEDDSATISRDKYQALLTGDFFYYAETNMPREIPREASERHGDSAWVYVAALLALVALEGGPRRAAEYLLRRDITRLRSGDDLGGRGLLDCLAQDLRNGMQIVSGDHEAEITDPEVAKNEHLADWVGQCAAG